MDKKGKILIVDDEAFYLELLVELLGSDYTLYIAKSGEQALERITVNLPDLILLDIVMPEMDGYGVCALIKADPWARKVPIIFLTGKSDQAAEIKAFEYGAVDFITKPIAAATVKARVKTHLTLQAALQSLEDQNQLLEQNVLDRTREIQLTQDAAIYSMASLAEARDNETGAHIKRTQHYIKLLAEELRTRPRFAEFLDSETITLLFKSAPLHDIGKVGVPDNILKKPGKLTPEEFSEMKKHTTYGRDAILRSEKELGSTSFLRYAREIAYSHQEKWDGSGYPLGLKGEEIPISARLMAVGDVYDALISRRVYKPALHHEEAVAYIVREKGRHFDPEIVEAFEQINPEFKRVADRFTDKAFAD